MGYSQLNELLLLHGYGRVTNPFFQFLVDGKAEYQTGASVPSIARLEEGIDRARKFSLLLYGNVKFGYKRLGREENELKLKVDLTRPFELDEFEKRHEHRLPVNPIPPGFSLPGKHHSAY